MAYSVALSRYGSLLRLAQSGYIRSYAAWVVVGSLLLIVFMGLKGAF